MAVPRPGAYDTEPDQHLHLARHRGDRNASIIVTDRKCEMSRIRLTQSPRLFHHRLEHRLEVATGRVDHAQHFGGRGLLLQRLVQFARFLLELFLQGATAVTLRLATTGRFRLTALRLATTGALSGARLCVAAGSAALPLGSTL